MLRRAIYQKRTEKEGGKVIENMLWGVPTGRKSHTRFEIEHRVFTSVAVQAQVLADFWLENYKIQVEARSGLLHVDVHGKSSWFSVRCHCSSQAADEPPKKRRKVRDPDIEDKDPNFNDNDFGADFIGDWNDPGGFGMDMNIGAGLEGFKKLLTSSSFRSNGSTLDYEVDGIMGGSGQIRSSEVCKLDTIAVLNIQFYNRRSQAKADLPYLAHRLFEVVILVSTLALNIPWAALNAVACSRGIMPATAGLAHLSGEQLPPLAPLAAE